MPRSEVDVRATLLWAGVLAISGALLTALDRSDGTPRVPRGDEVWELTLTAEIEPAKGDVIRLLEPQPTPSLRVIGQRVDHPGLKPGRRGPRGLSLACREPGPRRLQATWRLHHRPGAGWTAPQPPGADERADALRETPELPHSASAVAQSLAAIAGAKPPPAPELTRAIFAFCRDQLLPSEQGHDDVEGALASGQASARGRARTMVALCRAAGIPARVVLGAQLGEGDELPLRAWVEVASDARWVPYELVSGAVGEVPSALTPLSASKPGPTSPQLVSGGGVSRWRLSGRRLPGAPPRGDARDPRQILDLTRLPASSQGALLLLLMLPIGALLTASITTLTGARPFGTFTPTLLAATLLRTDPRVSTALLIAVLAFGLGGRTLLGRLGLDRTPRLSVIFLLVALSMTFVASALDFAGVHDAGGPALLPIVVLTMIVDRASTVADDLGPLAAVRRLFWTLAIAGSVAPLLEQRWIAEALLERPQAHLLTGAAFLLLGCYRGRQWLDTDRTRWLLEPEKPKRKRKPKAAGDTPAAAAPEGPAPAEGAQASAAAPEGSADGAPTAAVGAERPVESLPTETAAAPEGAAADADRSPEAG